MLSSSFLASSDMPDEAVRSLRAAALLPGLFLTLEPFDLGQVQRPLLGSLLRVVAGEPARPLEAQGLEVALVFLDVLAYEFQIVLLVAHQASRSRRRRSVQSGQRSSPLKVV